MAKFAIIKDDKIINVIEAENKKTAEKVTGLTAIETNGEPWTGWKLIDDVWTAPVIDEALAQ